MIYPSQKRFIQDAEKFTILPVAYEQAADLESPLSIFLKVRGQFLLESVEKEGSVGRYSIIGIGKHTEFILNGTTLTTNHYKKGKCSHTENCTINNPLIKIREYFSSFSPPSYISKLPPFFGGAIGYLGYETVSYFEKIPVNKEGHSIPDGILIIPETIIVYDNVLRNIYIIVCKEPDKGSPETAYMSALNKITEIRDLIDAPFELPHDDSFIDEDTDVKAHMSKQHFINGVKACKEHINNGDIIQAVFSQQFSLTTKAPPFELYRTLRILNPSPYLYYLDFDDFQIIGSSPEVMVRVQDGEVLLKPIAGTRPRGKSITEDNALAQELIHDPKERAEHLMLVDLGRNDLGRIAKTGSVDVTSYMEIERYSHVMHIVSTIKAELREHNDAYDVIKATFPAGTLSGAPKIRAMEILSELEPVKRGPYGGMVLNMSYSGNLDSCITIRTLVLKNNKAVIQAGAGIVADSDPDKEFLETVNKAKALVRAVQKTRKRLSA
jgi:anthranilate synthase component 1